MSHPAIYLTVRLVAGTLGVSVVFKGDKAVVWPLLALDTRKVYISHIAPLPKVLPDPVLWNSICHTTHIQSRALAEDMTGCRSCWLKVSIRISRSWTSSLHLQREARSAAGQAQQRTFD